MTRKYINRFAIGEDDQFEIHVKDYKDEVIMNKEQFRGIVYNAAEEVMLKAQQGWCDYRLSNKNYQIG